MGGAAEAPNGGSAPLDTATPDWMQLPAGAGLLFPSEQAHDLTLPCVSSNCAGHESNSLAMDAVSPTRSDSFQNGRGLEAPPSHLVVLDGTWSKAKRLYHENTWLRDLPHFKLPALNAPSNYSYIRRQPKANCMSTLESIVYALQLLEPQTEGLTSLLDAFKAMVADQVKCMQQSNHEPKKGHVVFLRQQGHRPESLGTSSQCMPDCSGNKGSKSTVEGLSRGSDF
eukprot:SM000321S12198  [mRNA]  locus=s321:68952:69812:+ [translate_table: standard]